MHTQTQNGYSPLTGASAKGYDGIVEMLLQAGATVDLQTKVEDCFNFVLLSLVVCHLLCSLYTNYHTTVCVHCIWGQDYVKQLSLTFLFFEEHTQI